MSIERERKQIPHCPASKPIVKQRIICLGQLAKWYKYLHLKWYFSTLLRLALLSVYKER